MDRIRTEFLKHYSEANYKILEPILQKYLQTRSIRRRELYQIVNFVRPTPYTSFRAGLSMEGCNRKQLTEKELLTIFDEFLVPYLSSREEEKFFWKAVLFFVGSQEGV